MYITIETENEELLDKMLLPVKDALNLRINAYRNPPVGMFTDDDIDMKLEAMDIPEEKHGAITDKVMTYLHKTFDASYGISWDSINCAIKEVLKNGH